MVKLVPQAIWETHPAQLAVTDKIVVQNLSVNVNAGVDVWGREKTQRALITVTLCLAKPFASAAEADALDKSTVHYGILSKAIHAVINAELPAHLSTIELAGKLVASARETAGGTPMASIKVDVKYPKGTMLGEGACLSHGYIENDDKVLTVLYLENLKIPCLIGVNSNERLRKQPVVVNVWAECINGARSDDYPKLEGVVVDAISGSSFETLESLSTMVVQQLRKKLFTEESDKETYIRLRVEKPQAVPSADAPAIEIFRPVRT